MNPHVRHIAPEQMRWPQGRPLVWARLLADLLTLSRVAGGVVLAFTPWEKGADSLGRIVTYNVWLWSTDAVDGRLARRSGTPASWIGARDIYVDAFLVLGSGVALVRSGYIPAWLLAAWTGLCLALYAVRPVGTVLLTFMFPLQLAVPVLAAVHRRPEIVWYLIWLSLIAFITRKRLKCVIENFINGLPEGPRRWVWSWLPRWLRLTEEERESFRMPEE